MDPKNLKIMSKLRSYVVTVTSTEPSGLAVSATAKLTEALGSAMFLGSTIGIQLSLTTSPDFDLTTPCLKDPKKKCKT